MTPNQYRAAIERLGLTQTAAARFLRAGARSSRRWALGGGRIPEAVSMVLRLMLALGLTPEQVDKILKRPRP